MSDHNSFWDKTSELPSGSPLPPTDSLDDRVNIILSLFTQFSTITNGLAPSQQQLYDALNSLAARVPTATARSAPAIHFREPPIFKGKPKELDGFLFAIQDRIDLQRHALTSNTERVTYMAGYLGEGSLASISTHPPYSPIIPLLWLCLRPILATQISLVWPLVALQLFVRLVPVPVILPILKNSQLYLT